MSLLSHRSPLIAIAAICAVLGVLAFSQHHSSSDAGPLPLTFTVTDDYDMSDWNLADDVCDSLMLTVGEQCTLRAAIEEANDEPGLNRIEFDFPVAGVNTIILLSALPPITEAVEIDGTTQGGCAADVPCVEIDGSATPTVDGLTLMGDGSTIRGLIINGFTEESAVLILLESSGNTIVGNYFGTNSTGMAADPNEIGVNIYGSDNQVGGDSAADRNILSGNGAGLIIIGTDQSVGNVVEGNYIGVGVDGETAVPNTGSGVDINLPQTDTQGENTIGPGNVISGNQGMGNTSGVFIMGSGARVHGNLIGTDATGEIAVPNDHGVVVSGQNITVGGDTPGERNVISGNTNKGIWALVNNGPVINNTISGNYIGTDADGTEPLGNGEEGVYLFEDISNNVIGGDSPSERNVIAANGEIGIRIWDSPNNQVLGNYIGTDRTGEEPMGNGFTGISVTVDGSDNNLIRGNVVVDNAQAGIDIIAGVNGTDVLANRVGITPSGDPLGNDGDGVRISDASGNLIGSPGDDANIIAHNGGAGVKVASAEIDTVDNTISGNSIHSNAGLGIDLDFGNHDLAAPVITGFGSVTGTACPNCTVEVFSDSELQGRAYEGSTTANGSGDWTLEEFPSGPNVTATATDDSGDTSEFSAAVVAPPTPTPEPTATSAVTPTATPGSSSTPGPSVTPTAVPTATPTPGPSETPGAKLAQGDVQCDDDVDSVDALQQLRDVAGLTTFQEDGCPQIGSRRRHLWRRRLRRRRRLGRRAEGAPPRRRALSDADGALHGHRRPAVARRCEVTLALLDSAA